MCLLCGDATRGGLGPLLPSLQVHLLCLRFSSGLLQSATPPSEAEVIREVKRAQKMTCVYCRKTGAFVGCGIKQCFRTYHLHCGVAHGALHQYDKFVSYCRQHRPLFQLLPNPAPICQMCHQTVDRDEDWLMCPVKECSTGLHRQCIQARADTGDRACPGCGEAEQFSEEMNFYGIWFKNMAGDTDFVQQASKEPSSHLQQMVKALTTHSDLPILPPLQTSGSSSTQATSSSGNSFRSTDLKNPVSLIASQAKMAPPTPSNIPIKSTNETSAYNFDDILTVDSDSSIDNRITKKQKSVVFDPEDIMTVDSESSSRGSSRDSSPAYRRKVPRLPGRSPKKRVAKMISSSNDWMRKSRELELDTVRRSQEARKAAEGAAEEGPGGSSRTLFPAVKKVKVSTPSESSDCFLSDIDDILSGDTSDPENHPMRDLIFSNQNKHLPALLEKLQSRDSKISDDNDKKAEVPKPKTKSKNKKESKAKKGKDSPRKVLLKKKVAKKFEVPETTEKEKRQPKSKEIKTKTVKFLPLSERRVFHGRNWVPRSAAMEPEEDCSTEWFKKFSQLRIEDIADMNSSEKTLMTLWNNHMQGTSGAGVLHMDHVMTAFLLNHAETIVAKNLMRNFVSHATTFQQAGLVTPHTVYKCLLLLQQMTDRRLQPDTAPGSQFAASWTQRKVVAVEEPNSTPGAGTVSGHHAAPRHHEEEAISAISEVSTSCTSTTDTSAETTFVTASEGGRDSADGSTPEDTPAPSSASPSASGVGTKVKMTQLLLGGSPGASGRGLQLLSLARSSAKHDASPTAAQDSKRQRLSESPLHTLPLPSQSFHQEDS